MSSPDTAELRAMRARSMERLRKLEWEFDRHPTFDLVDELRQVRVEITDTEDMIANITATVEAERLLERAQSLKAQDLLKRVSGFAT